MLYRKTAFLICSTFFLLFCSLCESPAQNSVKIDSLDKNGRLSFLPVANAAHYQIQWAPSSAGPWTNFSAAANTLDFIEPSGLNVITSEVPMFFRVLAVITNPTPDGMTLIPEGDFVMGCETNVGHPARRSDEIPQHIVYISAFYMDVHQITKTLWDDVKNYNGGNGYSYSNTGSAKAANHPVQTVDWYDCLKWANARSEKEGLTPVYYTDASFSTVYKTGELVPFADWNANGYRLPTEAEWEKAARGGLQDKRFPWGDRINHTLANYSAFCTSNVFDYSYDDGPECGYHPTFATGGFPYTNPVGYFSENGYGLYGMAGNVLEWCWDYYDDTYYSTSPLNNPRGPETGTKRIARGGYWINPAITSRIANRYNLSPEWEMYYAGLRLVRNAP